jgi:CheY-like chemotaxis protein
VPEDELASQPLANRKLLLADNSNLPSKLFEQHCRSWGVELQQVKSAADAISQLQQAVQSHAPFDFIALGHELADMSGMALAQAIRSEPTCSKVPIFILSANDTAIDQASLQQLSIHALLRKPISAKTLKLELSALLGQSIAPLPPSKQVEQDYHLFSHLHVLVAEDNAVNRMVIKGLLGKLHIEPELVDNGLAAFNAVRQTNAPYDLILMDCEMPEMDGFEATRSIREFERSHNQAPTPIVALTAHALQEHRDAVFACGMNHYLSKPITLDSLYATFEKTGLMKQSETKS